MNKAILLAIRPEWVAKILNGEKTIEVRKKFPKDYVGWVYLYCSKNGGYTGKVRNGVDCYDGELYKYNFDKGHKVKGKKGLFYDGETLINNINGKVVARFWCNKVEELVWDTDTIDENLKGIHWIADEDFEKTCLTYEEYENYLEEGKNGYAIHISKLEIFDRPKELSEFYTTKLDEDLTKRFDNSIQLENGTWVKPITKAPQNFCYCEVLK